MALGVADVDALRESLTPNQFIGWIAFDRLEPIGQAWRLAAVMTAAAMNNARGIAASQAGNSLEQGDYVEPDELLGHEVEQEPVDEWAMMRQMAGGIHGR